MMVIKISQNKTHILGIFICCNNNLLFFLFEKYNFEETKRLMLSLFNFK